MDQLPSKFAGAGRTGLLVGEFRVVADDGRFLRILRDASLRPPASVPRITTVRSVVLSNHPTRTTVGLTRYHDVKYLLVFSHPEQTITFYSDLLDALSDKAAEGVVAHELAHAWLNEHAKPEESAQREAEADKLARDWGFGPELDALDHEAETVN